MLKIIPKGDKYGAIQTLDTNLSVEVAVQIKSLVLFNKIYRDTKSFDDGEYYLKLWDYDCQTKKLNLNSGQTASNFTVPSTTTEISLFAQSTTAGSRDNTYIPPSLFKSDNFSSDNIRHKTLTFANSTKPSVNYESNYTSKTQGIVQRYYSHIQHIDLDELSCENLNDWITNGGLYTTSFYRSEMDNSTQLQVLCDFGDMADETELFVICKMRKLCKIKIQDGFVVGVVLIDA